MNPIRLGIVGVGSIVRWAHIPALQYIPEIALRGVVSSRAETTQAAAERYRTRGFASPQEMIESPDIEAVLIATNSGHHVGLMRAALDAGKHVFVESGGGSAVAAAAPEFIATAEKKQRVVQIGHGFRYSPLVDLLQHHLAAAARPRVWAYEYFPYIGHIYNLAVYVSGPFDRVVGHVATPAGVLTTIAFKSGDTAVVIGRSIANCSMEIESIRVSAKDFYGAIEERRRVRIAKGLKSVAFDDWSTASSPAITYEAQAGGRLTLEVSGYIPQLKAFAKCIREGGAVRSDLAGAIETQRIAEAIAKAG